jgi:hypothetical protein
VDVPETEVAGTALQRNDHYRRLLDVGSYPHNIQIERIANFIPYYVLVAT